MKHILSVVLIVAVMGFIAAQPSPRALAACKAYVNSTEAAFCSATTYQVANSTDLAQVNIAAKALYDNIITKITNPSAACVTALTAFACQGSLPKCGRYFPVLSIAQARCDAVTTACNVTGFPSNFTALECVSNNLVTIDGTQPVCVPSAFTTLGANCQSNLFDPKIPTPTVIQTVACPLTSQCNTTGTTSTCVRPSTLGETCTGVGAGSCVSIAGSPSTPLQCLGGRCTYGGKRHAQTCTVNEECRSNKCITGTCFESAFGGNCSSTLQCRDNLWCDIRNQTCYNVAQANEQCGIVQSDWSPVPCVNGFTCVRDTSANSTGFSYCRPNAELGARCSVSAAAIVYDFPLCEPQNVPATGFASCINGICSAGSGRTEGQQCNATATCSPNLTCKYATTADTNGVCSQPNTVACDTAGGAQCNFGQVCSCTADVNQPGTCSLNNNDPLVRCVAQTVAVGQCFKDRCKTLSPAFVPYDQSSCAAVECNAQINAYFCCVKGVVGANYVNPPGAPAEPCQATTTVAPGTTAVPGPNTPTPTPSRSGASNVAVSFIAMIVAIIAFCL